MCKISPTTVSRIFTDPEYNPRPSVMTAIQQGLGLPSMLEIWRDPLADANRYSLATLVQATMDYHGYTSDDMFHVSGVSGEVIRKILEEPGWEPEPPLPDVIRINCYRRLPGGSKFDEIAQAAQAKIELRTPLGQDLHVWFNPKYDLARIIDSPQANVRGIPISNFKRELIKWAMGLRSTLPELSDFAKSL